MPSWKALPASLAPSREGAGPLPKGPEGLEVPKEAKDEPQGLRIAAETRRNGFWKALWLLLRLQESLQRIEGMQESTSERLRAQQEDMQEGDSCGFTSFHLDFTLF